MYLSHWGLARKPFENTSDPALYYPSEVHQGALLKLRWAIENHHSCAVLGGPSGVGKTLIVHALGRQLAERFTPLVHLVYPQMGPNDLVAYLADSLSAGSPGNADLTGRRSLPDDLRRIERALADNVAEGRHAVIVIDEAHMLEDLATFETLRLLLNFHSEGGMTLLLCGQPQLLPTLDRLPALEERLGIKCLLRPFTLEETMGYVGHRLRAAGCGQEILSHETLETLFQLTHGIPRRINRLCDLALLVGFADERDAIGPQDLEAVCQELITVAPD